MKARVDGSLKQPEVLTMQHEGSAQFYNGPAWGSHGGEVQDLNFHAALGALKLYCKKEVSGKNETHKLKAATAASVQPQTLKLSGFGLTKILCSWVASIMLRKGCVAS